MRTVAGTSRHCASRGSARVSSARKITSWQDQQLSLGRQFWQRRPAPRIASTVLLPLPLSLVQICRPPMFLRRGLPQVFALISRVRVRIPRIASLMRLACCWTCGKRLSRRSFTVLLLAHKDLLLRPFAELLPSGVRIGFDCLGCTFSPPA